MARPIRKPVNYVASPIGFSRGGGSEMFVQGRRSCLQLSGAETGWCQHFRLAFGYERRRESNTRCE